MIDTSNARYRIGTRPSARRGAGLLALTLGLAVAVFGSAALAGAGEHRHIGKKSMLEAADGQLRSQARRAHGDRGQWRHGRPGTAVECGDVLSVAGNYALNSDLVCTSPIQITGSNVHLDLAGHSISCDPGNWAPSEEFLLLFKPAIFANYDGYVALRDGVDPALVPALTGISVRNGRITRCAVGIFLARSDHARVTNVHLDGNNAPIPEFELDGGLAGILTAYTNHSTFTDNRFSGSFRGIELDLSNNNRISRNHIEANAEDAIGLYGSSDNAVQRNVVTGNLGGIWIQTIEGPETSRNLISSNNLSDNGADGITMLGIANDNVVRNNTLTENAGAGIKLFGAVVLGLPVPARNTVQRNAATGNETDLVEGDQDEDLNLVLPANCSNTWKHNTFGTSFGPEGCIR